MHILLVLKLVLTLISGWVWGRTVVQTREIIRDINGEPYLIRYFLWRPDWLDYFQKGLSKKAGRIYLHHILKSDYDRALHDHPWNFRSFMLFGGYREYTTVKDLAKNSTYLKPVTKKWEFVKWPLDRENIYTDFQAPCYIKRPASWRHRLEIEPGKTALTLVFIGPVVRRWGFWTTLKTWCHWKNYNLSTGLCEESQ